MELARARMSPGRLCVAGSLFKLCPRLGMLATSLLAVPFCSAKQYSQTLHPKP
jgi:hypothetical protein